jgi:hypothetical protein
VERFLRESLSARLSRLLCSLARLSKANTLEASQRRPRVKRREAAR